LGVLLLDRANAEADSKGGRATMDAGNMEQAEPDPACEW
jgi:hypothetical protein